nr:wall-associated receptor kinase 5-like [Tanacetum cinerariifolium]
MLLLRCDSMGDLYPITQQPPFTSPFLYFLLRGTDALVIPEKTYKAPLVVKGSSKQQGIDCDETFSLMVKPATIRTVLSLYGHLTKTVYMHQPPRDLDSLNYFLGISSQQTASGMFLSQSKFAKEILERAHIQKCNSCNTLVDIELKLGPDVCRYMHDPRDPYFTALKRILRYSGLVALLLVGLPQAEAVYHGVANVVAKTAWICNLLCELHAPIFIATLLVDSSPVMDVHVILYIESSIQHRLFEIFEPRLIREGTLDNLRTLADLVKRYLSLQSHDRPKMKEVAMELDGLRKLTTNRWIPQTSQETRSLVLEVEQYDLYVALIVSYGPNESDSYSGTRKMEFEENEPHSYPGTREMLVRNIYSWNAVSCRLRNVCSPG